jgi:hypothetical protein
LIILSQLQLIDSRFQGIKSLLISSQEPTSHILWQSISQLQAQNPTNAPISTSLPIESGQKTNRTMYNATPKVHETYTLPHSYFPQSFYKGTFFHTQVNS